MLWNQSLGYFLHHLKDSAEISVHPAAPVKCHAGPVGSRLWRQQGQHSEGILSGGRHTEIGHFCDVWIGWTRAKKEQSPVCPWTPASNTHQQSSGKRNQYRLMLCSGSIRYIRLKTKQEKRDRAKEEMRIRREQWGTFSRPTLLPIVIRQFPSLPPLHNADVISPCYLPVRSCCTLFPNNSSIVQHLQKWLIYFNLVFILLSFMYPLYKCHEVLWQQTKLKRFNQASNK